MDKTVSMIGIEPAELRWVRTLVSLLRHPDPSVPELTRQALLYLSEQCAARSRSGLPAPTGAELPGKSRLPGRP